jgi:hypothetical protein
MKKKDLEVRVKDIRDNIMVIVRVCGRFCGRE